MRCCPRPPWAWSWRWTASEWARCASGAWPNCTACSRRRPRRCLTRRNRGWPRFWARSRPQVITREPAGHQSTLSARSFFAVKGGETGTRRDGNDRPTSPFVLILLPSWWPRKICRSENAETQRAWTGSDGEKSRQPPVAVEGGQCCRTRHVRTHTHTRSNTHLHTYTQA